MVGGDVDGDALTCSLDTESSNDTLTSTVDKITNSANEKDNGVDTFTYKVNDGTVDS